MSSFAIGSELSASGRRLVDDGRFELPDRHRVGELRAEPIGQRQLDLRVTCGELQQRVRQHTLGDRLDHPDAYLPRELRARLQHLLARAREIADHRKKEAIHATSLARGLHALRRAHEKLAFELVLQPGDLHAQRGLHDVQAPCGARYRPLFVEADEVLDLTKFHGLYLHGRTASVHHIN